MKLSENTLAVLKNFSSINSGILFKSGNVVRTISPQKNIIGKAEIDESFDRDFAIYDLPRFLGVLSLFDAPEIVLAEKQVQITDGKKKLVYLYADASTFATPPDKDLKFPDTKITFTLKADDLAKVQRAGNVLQLPELALVGDGSTIALKAFDSKEPNGDAYNLEGLGETEEKFVAIFKNENLRMIPNDYEVSIASKGITRFVSKRVTYWVAQEQNSTFA